MNYFVSCLYGDAEKYRKIKDDIRLKEKDHLWILGDILDGNDDNPEACLEILNDIMHAANVTLILGDHEYARCMEFIMSHSNYAVQSWRNFSESLEISGASFNEMADYFNEEERKKYFSYLVSCELSAVVPIGKRYFYIVHGKPTFYDPIIFSEWQLSTCKDNPDLRKNAWTEISTDEIVLPFTNKTSNPMTGENTITIVGQMSASLASNMLGVECHGSSVFLANKTLAIGRTYTDEPIPVVGIDAAGFFIAGLY